MKKRVLLPVMLPLLMLLCFNCSKDQSLSENRTTVTPSTGKFVNEAPQITIKNTVFEPDAVEVLKGGAVVWYNADNDIHNITFDNGMWDSGDLYYKATANFTFETAGTYSYHCTHHAGQKGVVIVR